MSIREDFEEWTMPAGAVCFYRDPDHSYWKSIKLRSNEPDAECTGVGRLTGVSTVSTPFDWRSDNLMRWAAKTNGIGIARLAKETLDGLSPVDPDLRQLAWLEDPETIWSALQETKLTYAHIRDKAAVRGTNVHKLALHALASGETVPRTSEMTPEERGYARGIYEFWLDHNPAPIQAEQVVCDLELGVAGRFDLRCLIDGETVCLDAKTSGFIPNKHHVQLAGYEHCAIASGFGPSDRLLILQVGPDGGYELIPVCASGEDFLLAVAVYRRSAEIEKAAKRA